MRRLLVPLAALLLLVLVIAGCGGGGSSSSSSEGSTEAAEEAPAEEAEASGGEAESEGASGGGKSVAYISPVAAQPGQQQVNEGLERGAEELGWSEFVLDSDLSPEKQVSAIETAVNKNVDAITSWTLDPNAAAGAYEKAQSKDIPVIGMNSVGPGLDGTIWWEIELCEPGGAQQVAAEKMAEINPGGKTILIGFEGAESTLRYQECFAKEAKKAGLEIINETNNEADNAAGSQKVFEPLLTKYPEVENVWCYNDESAMGVSAALLAAGKTIATTESKEGIVVTGQNGDQDAIEAVEEGRLSWTWDPDNLASGFAAIRMMNEVLEGKKTKELVVESKIVDSETVGEYEKPEERDYTLATIPLKK